MPNRLLLASALLLLAASACAPARLGGAQGEEKPHWAAPDLDQAARVFDGRTRHETTLRAMLGDLAQADVVFLGETHLDETTHRLEAAVYRYLIEQTGGRVTLAMEMFERDVQPVLDDYLAGRIAEAEFLEKSRPWGNYGSAYRPLIETAKEHGLPVVASNAPAGLRRKLAMGGREAFEQLDPAEKALLPPELFPSSDAYWRRVDNAVRGHVQMMGPSDPESRLFSAQSLWDNTMAHSCAEALARWPKNLVLHVNGGFHSSRFDGTVSQLLQRRPDTRVMTVEIEPVQNPSVAEPGAGGPVADFVAFVEARARDAEDGTHAVTVGRELCYRLHLPARAADAPPTPLLIWLCDDGFTCDDGIDLWVERLGAGAAIAALAPPYPETQEDLQVGGRWFWPETFDKDLGFLAEGIGRISGYLLRHHALDPSRVVIAGEGTGATIAAAVAAHAGEPGLKAVALLPRGFSKLRDLPLPLPEEGAAPPPAGDAVSLSVIAQAADMEWWEKELADYRGTGLGTSLALLAEDPWRRERQIEAALGAALGLAPRARTEGARRVHAALENASPRARFWARLHALRAAAATGTEVAVLLPGEEARDSTPLDLSIRAADFARPGALPLAPGPFGGTTVVVLPAGLPEEERAAWRALEEQEVLSKHSRFHRLRVALPEGDKALEAVLARLEQEKRKNVLIVPAVFCAAPEEMRRLRGLAAEHDDDMTLHWCPGLGARLGLARGE
ncbi:MAG: ChaN family lipoprotein [Planctomycetes bacterium]|nr:ChaN family lipoprotein [Planctomycetota bacterium]